MNKSQKTPYPSRQGPSLANKLAFAESSGNTFVVTKIWKPIVLYVNHLQKTQKQGPVRLMTVLSKNLVLLINRITLVILFLLPLILSILTAFDLSLNFPFTNSLINILFLPIVILMVTLPSLNRYFTHGSLRVSLGQISLHFLMAPSFVKGFFYKLLGKTTSSGAPEKIKVHLPIFILLISNATTFLFLNQEIYLMIWGSINVTIILLSTFGVHYYHPTKKPALIRMLKAKFIAFHLVVILLLVYLSYRIAMSINFKSLIFFNNISVTICNFYLTLFFLSVLASLINQSLISYSFVHKNIKG